jgi:hypothetical protein
VRDALERAGSPLAEAGHSFWSVEDAFEAALRILGAPRPT